ncbi:MAG: DUF1778 domain-containing protein [Proteobacteria bacterium]|nr:DUF1778 domain-containing protein [Pseudomonadota bacterium]
MRSAAARRGHVDSARARINTRVSKEVHARLEEASELVGATINQFVLQAALKEADRVIEHERVIMPSARDARMILESLDDPSPPNAKLRAAMKRYKEAFGGASNRTPG